MDPLSFRQMGDPAAVGSKYGSTAGSETRTVYPQTAINQQSTVPGNTVIFNWSSDETAFWQPSTSRLQVEYQFKFGEVSETASVLTDGAKARTTPAPPAPSVRMAAMCNSALFDSQVRFVQNSVTLESCPNFYTTTCAQMLLHQNAEGPETSGSNMLNSLRKDRGIPDGIQLGGSRAKGAATSLNDCIGDGSSRQPLVAAETYLNADLDQTSTDSLTLAHYAANKTTGAFVVTLASEASAGKAIVVTDPDGAFSRLMNAPGTGVTGDALKSVAGGDALKVETGVIATAVWNSTYKWTTVTADVDIVDAGKLAAGTSVSIQPAVATIEQLTIAQLAEVFHASVGSTVQKDTNPNAKFEILQQSWDEASGVCTVQTSQPLYLSTWMHPYAIANSAYQLHLTISPDAMKNIIFDHAGAYGCDAGSGACLQGFPATGANYDIGQIYCEIKDVSLANTMIFPIEPYVPKSMSFKTQPYTVAVKMLTNSLTVNETVTVPASTRSVLCFLRQRHKHVCIDREEVGLAGGGIVVSGTAYPDTVAQEAALAGSRGRFEYFSDKLSGNQDLRHDPRLVASNGTKTLAGIERKEYNTYGFSQIQVALGNAVAPREMVSLQDGSKAKMMHLWKLYSEFVHRSHGYRSIPLNYAEFCGTFSSNYASGAGCGDRTSGFFLAEVQNPPGTLATDLQIRGQLQDTGDGNNGPQGNAEQELVVIAVSDSLVNIGWTPGNNMATLTEVNPIV